MQLTDRVLPITASQLQQIDKAVEKLREKNLSRGPLSLVVINPFRDIHYIKKQNKGLKVVLMRIISIRNVAVGNPTPIRRIAGNAKFLLKY